MARGRRRSRRTGWLPSFLLFAATWLLAALAAGAQPQGTVHASADDVEPLAPGSRVPSVQVRTVEGSVVDLAEALRSGGDAGALLVFYRGGW